MEYQIIHDNSNNNFYVNIEDKISYLRYRVINNIIEFYVTFVDPSLRGRGIAAKLVEEGIKYAQEMNYKILPSCSYAAEYIGRKKEYTDLLAE
ncbi:MAG: GNAT family N-acetyltransferase [Bacteroidota bacterium]|nr:GNAT family N-acetyltransferase [Bacteroidota bacterium]